MRFHGCMLLPAIADTDVIDAPMLSNLSTSTFLVDLEGKYTVAAQGSNMNCNGGRNVKNFCNFPFSMASRGPYTEISKASISEIS